MCETFFSILHPPTCREDDIEGSLQLVLDALKERIEKQDGTLHLITDVPTFTYIILYPFRIATVRSAIIDVATIQSIVAELSSSEEDLAQESVQVGICFVENRMHFSP